MKNIKSYLPIFSATGVIAIYSLGIAFAVKNHDMTFESTSKSQIWSQPENVKTSYEISPYTFKINFETIELTLSKLQVDKSGNIRFNAQSAKLLEQASGYISTHFNIEDIDRAYWLIDKIHPQNNTKQLSHLISTYRTYLRAREEQKKIKMTPRKKLQQSIKLAESYFGVDTSNALFGEKHKLARYIIDRQEILKSKTFSNHEKQRRLLALKNQLN